MTRILGIDPGASTGFVVWDTAARRVLSRGTCRAHDLSVLYAHEDAPEVVVLERLVPHGASYPQVVEAAYTSGRLVGRASLVVHELIRQDVRSRLQDATHGAIKVRDDKTVRAALEAILGPFTAAERKTVLLGVSGHEWAALAAAVAWALPGREG